MVKNSKSKKASNLSPFAPLSTIWWKTSLIYLSLLVLPPASYCQIRVSSFLYNDSPGKTSATARTSVFRIQCPTTRSAGTGFLHSSGKILTAAHVVTDCPKLGIRILIPSGKEVKGTVIAIDSKVDLAVISPNNPLPGTPLLISNSNSLSLGAQTVTWGFPDGYSNLEPMLSVGHLSGIDFVPVSETETRKRLVVNAAFNSGNSGGPLVDVESGEVIGVVSTKLAPIPQDIQTELDYLKNHEGGIYSGGVRRQFPDGTSKLLSRGQVIADVLFFLRRQTQLVIGHAVMLGDLRDFLTKNDVTP